MSFLTATEIQRLLEEQHKASKQVAEQDIAVKFLSLLTNEQRVNVFNRFCIHCGSTDATCNCWNEE